jgi:integrase
MSVRKRTWTTAKGEAKEAWIVDYVDQEGDRHIETFDLKKDADAYHDEVRINVRKGTHTAPSKSLTVAEAAQAWIDFVRLEGASAAPSSITRAMSISTSTRDSARKSFPS